MPGGLAGRTHLQRLSRMQAACVLRAGTRLDHEDQAGAVLLAVDDGRGVFGLARDETDPGRNWRTAAVALQLDFLAEREAAQLLLRQEKARLDIGWRQQRQ